MRDTVVALTPTSLPGFGFTAHEGTEQLRDSSTDDSFNRAVRVVSNRDTTARTRFVDDDMEVEGTIQLQIGYHAFQNDEALVDRVDEDDEQIMKSLMAHVSPANKPLVLCDIMRQSAVLEDLGAEGGRNAMMLSVDYLIIYTA